MRDVAAVVGKCDAESVVECVADFPAFCGDPALVGDPPLAVTNEDSEAELGLPGGLSNVVANGVEARKQSLWNSNLFPEASLLIRKAACWSRIIYTAVVTRQRRS